MEWSTYSVIFTRLLKIGKATIALHTLCHIRIAVSDITYRTFLADLHAGINSHKGDTSMKGQG